MAKRQVGKRWLFFVLAACDPYLESHQQAYFGPEHAAHVRAIQELATTQVMTYEQQADAIKKLDVRQRDIDRVSRR